MAASRLPAAWNTIWRSSELTVHNPALRSARAAVRNRAYHPSRRRWQQQEIPQRYGTANAPPEHLGGWKELGPATRREQHPDHKELPKIGEKLQKAGEKEVQAEQQQTQETSSKVDESEKKEPATVEGRVTPQMYDPMLDSGEAEPEEPPPPALKIPQSNPMESVLSNVPDPAQQKRQDDSDTHAEDHHDKSFDEHSPPLKAPHIEPPRYVHHFDTYGLVKRLVEGGWTEERAITAMKSVRLMLADNTDLAKEALVSKSNLENEAYLFKAACAELKTEVTNRRKTEQEKLRTERTQLQHEVDILSQRQGQETTTLKDELKGMFDDRKMAVRNEQRDMESKIQQLNYRITVELSSDAKSDVEGLRMIMTRRVILTLAIVVFMVLGSLKLASTYVVEGEEGKRRAAAGTAPTSTTGTQTEASVGTQTAGFGGGGEVVVKEGDSAGFVSLG